MSFVSDLDKFAKTFNANTEMVTKKVAIEIGNSLVQMSPVDTGRFRANWQHGYGVPNLATTEQTDKGDATSGRLEASILSGYGDVTYITNSLPYAKRLEDGWSKQAPSGMVRITAARFQQFVKLAVTGLE